MEHLFWLGVGAFRKKQRTYKRGEAFGDCDGVLFGDVRCTTKDCNWPLGPLALIAARSGT